MLLKGEISEEDYYTIKGLPVKTRFLKDVDKFIAKLDKKSMRKILYNIEHK